MIFIKTLRPWKKIDSRLLIKMLKCRRLVILMIILIIGGSALAADMRNNFVYQKDKSEHCRRRVMPSVFLGRHVMVANSQILHFSRLEVPYSCFVSVRTESGSNIILVIQIALDGQENVCAGQQSPVKVFEMSETFGGYWGPFPDSILYASRSDKEEYYTLRATTVAPLVLEDTESYEGNEAMIIEESTTAISTTWHPEVEDTRNYVRVEVPLMNVSGRFVYSDTKPELVFGLENFDILPDVLPKPGEQYRSTLMPLLQFSVSEDILRDDMDTDVGSQGNASVEATRSQGNTSEDATMFQGNPSAEDEQRYQLDYNFGDFTPDPRLQFLYATGSAMRGKKYKFNANKILKFKKIKGQMFSPANHTPSYLHKKKKYSTSSWAYIEALLNNHTSDHFQQINKENESEEFSVLLHKISDWQHNYSAYLAPNLTSYNFSSSQLEHLQGKITSSLTSRATSREQPVSKRFSLIEKNSLASTNDDTKEAGSTSVKTVGDQLLEEQREIKSDINTTSEFSESTSREDASTSITLENFTTERIIDITTAVTDVTKSTVIKVSNFVTDITKKLLDLGTTIPQKVIGRQIENQTKLSMIQGKDKKTDKFGSQTTAQGLTISHSIMTTPVATSMLDRESWGNVVNAAPKIAGKLNQNIGTKPIHNKYTIKDAEIHNMMPKKREKRSIHAIPIEHARPHNQTTNSDIQTTSERLYQFADMHDFAQLVEAQDDGLNGHIALRYMRRYVGAELFDFCNDSANRTRLVFLFNTSRIVIALNNFTLKRMTIVATPARTLSSPEMQCFTNLLECQVAGARVCIDTMTECDGVPNCGAYDIYDEDRLRCGGAKGLQHNVYLAAITLLAVLFTLVYTIHYWLKRCIPKVSEAFFIYTDGTENILFLDSIMRSPLSHDQGSKLMYQSLFQHDSDLIVHRKKRKNIFKKIFGFCFNKKKSYVDFEMTADLPGNFKTDKSFSFSEVEIRRLHLNPAVEVAVQTGLSLEMEPSEKVYEDMILRKESIDPRSGLPELRLLNDDVISRNLDEDSELNMLKFFRGAREELSEKFSSKEEYPDKDESTSRILSLQTKEETELKSTVYNRSIRTASLDFSEGQILKGLSPDSATITTQVNDEALRTSEFAITTKRIRFEENIKKNSSHDMKKENVHDTGSEREHFEAGSSGRDFRRFWGSSNKGNKGKKLKNKTQSKLPLNK